MMMFLLDFSTVESIIIFMAGGRPTSYDPSFCERIINLGKLGYSQTEMAADIGISKQTFFVWKSENQEFSDAIATARTYSQAWWERKGRESLDADKFQAAVYNKRIAGMFPDDYIDKNKVDHGSSDGTMSPTHVDDKELVRRLAFMLQELINKQSSDK